MSRRSPLTSDEPWDQGVKGWGVGLVVCVLAFGLDRSGFFGGIRGVVEMGVDLTAKPARLAQALLMTPVTWVMYGRTAEKRIADLEDRLAAVSVDQARLTALSGKLAAAEALVEAMPPGKRAERLAQFVQSDNQLWISVGSREGVRSGQLVTDEHGILVGRVGRVGIYMSTVETPALGRFKIPVTTTSGSARGVIEGQRGTVLLSGVLQTESLAVGDVLLTSGIDGLWPAGLVVGQVVSLTGLPADIVKGGTVELLAKVTGGWGALW